MLTEYNAELARVGQRPPDAFSQPVSQMLTEYNTELARVGQRPPDAFSQPGGDISSELMKAVDVLPDLADKKRALDAHTTIATAVVNGIRERELDR
ncbi:sec1 family domain-containing protein, putative [Eimeria mitis]|uniref:Sec1 family domain-containing protein, putative n=1 Tax=Eimeria mitis TaxID=44415 RepID=U6JYK6_9EIME|nr:sec1 family domain-containing protein, putative [Eimeria mitis]CDJ30499.1 sec1 family domain-containing protein, putative [Eimeria mitis]